MEKKENKLPNKKEDIIKYIIDSKRGCYLKENYIQKHFPECENCNNTFDGIYHLANISNVLCLKCYQEFKEEFKKVNIPYYKFLKKGNSNTYNWLGFNHFVEIHLRDLKIDKILK